MSALHPNVFTIPSHMAFLPALADGLLARHFKTEDPLAFARVTVYLPTRRATRALGEHLLAAAQRRGLAEALALPLIRPLGDVDDDMGLIEEGSDALDIPPAIPALRRRLLLMRLVRAFRARKEGHDGLSAAQGLKLAQALERFLDHAETQGISLDGLAGLVTGDLAAHWRDVVEFLAIVTRAWPDLEASEGAIGGGARRNRLIEALTARLAAHPPSDPVIAAGSTGTIPATAQLLKAISRLPQGAVILPGLDQTLDDAAWQMIDVSHLQGAMKALLDVLAVTRDDVRPYAGPAGAVTIRTRILNEALRPWDATGTWRDDIGGLRAALAGAEGIGVSILQAPHRAAEADAIALIMRETLQRPGETGALVTPDRTLARSVAAALMRWNIAVDDSAGEPLGTAPGAVFFRLLAEAAETELAPVTLLALLKHPLTRLGMAPRDLALAVEALERQCLRGPRPAPGLAGLTAARDAYALHARGRENPARVDDLIARLIRSLGPFAAAMAAPQAVPFASLIEAHLAAGEALAAHAGKDAAHLWQGDAGEALGALFEEMLTERDDLPDRPPADYPAFLDAMLAGRVVRPRFGRHPRLFIWGPLEARLQSCDVMILGGLNDGTWPAETPPDPWLSRGMAKGLGLPPPEQRLGLAAHDFVQGAGAAHRVYLTRASKVDGTPTVASRWLMRLETLMRGLGHPDALISLTPWLSYAAALDIPPARQGPLDPPAPAPPVAARPRELAVTRIGTWLRDPYAIYARYILKLKPLDPLDLEADARVRGIIVHETVEAMLRHGLDVMRDDALERLLALGEEIFARARIAPATAAFWRPRFAASAQWLIETERAWAAQGARPLAAEIEGRIEISDGTRPFILTARADRIDRAGDGGLIIVDFKTGRAPSVKEIESCIEPQMPLQAMIAMAGGFEGIGEGPVAMLRIVQLMQRVQKASTDVMDIEPIAARAREYLTNLIARYDRAETAYRSRVMVHSERDVGDYDHLARVMEWSAGGEGDE